VGRSRSIDIKTLESPDGNERVLISQRADGHYTYRRQWRSTDSQFKNVDEEGWGPPSEDCGIYDSADTAETEARQRVLWLKRQFH
jgi:hypothetical protein